MPSRRPSLLAAAAVALAAAAALAQTISMPKVNLDYDKDVDFSSFKTFSWKDNEPVATTPGMHARIVWYVERELEKKGLVKAPEGKGDLFVRYYAKKREGFKGTPNQEQSYLSGAPSQLTTSVDFTKVTEGTLLLELQRASDEKAVWRAGTNVGTIDKKRIDADTARAVRMLVAKYPPPKAEPASAP